MDAILTNRGKYLLLEWAIQDTNEPTQFYFILIADGSGGLSVDTNTMASLTEIAAGNGYTSGGVTIARSSFGKTLTQDNTNDLAKIVFGNVTACIASGGSIPTSGGLIRYAALTTDEATVADRQIIAIFDLDPTGETGYSVPDAKQLDVLGHEIRISTPT